jgi:hypothetical protein
MPLAPNFIAVCIARFSARRKATRRSSCCGDVLGDQLRVDLGLADLLDVQEDLVVGERLDLLLELLDAGAALADDDARARGEKMLILQLVRGALHLDVRDARERQLLLDEALELQILMKPLGVVLVLVPPRRPGLDDAEAEAGGVRFLAHVSSSVAVRWG